MRTGPPTDLGLPRLFSELRLTRFTGQLLIQADTTQHLLFLRDGALAHVTGRYEGNRLGEVLVELGALTAANHGFSLAIKPPEGLRYGSIILRYGMAPPALITQALCQQMRRRLVPLFAGVGDGYQMEAGDHHEGFLADGTPVRLDLRQVLYDGAQGLDPARLEQLLQPIYGEQIHLPPDVELEPFGFSEGDDWVIQRLAGGPCTLAALSQLPGGRRALPVVHALWLGGALNLVAGKAHAAPAAAAPAPVAEVAQSPPPRDTQVRAAPRQTGEQATVRPAPRPAERTGERQEDSPSRPGGVDPALLAIDLEHLRVHLAQEDLFGILCLPVNTHTAVIQRTLSTALTSYTDESLAQHGLSRYADTARAIRERLLDAAHMLREGKSRQGLMEDLLHRRAAPQEPVLEQARGERMGRRARVFLTRGHHAAAALEVEAALRIQPMRQDYQGLRAFTRFAAGHISAAWALRALEEARRADPACADLHYLAGLVHLREGRDAEAEAALQETLRVDPAHREATQSLQELQARRQAGRRPPQPEPAESVSLIEVLNQPVGPGLLDAMRRPLSGIGPAKEPAAPPAPMSLMDVLRQPVGAGLLSAMRRPLSGIASTRPAPAAPAAAPAAVAAASTPVPPPETAPPEGPEKTPEKTGT